MLLGIDYGTTRTVVAAVDRGNSPVVSFHTADGDTQDWYPSLITARGDARLYGLDAACHQDDPDWALLRSFKRPMATLGPAAQLPLGTGAVTALELLTAFLAQLRRRPRHPLDLRLSPQEPLEAVIAVPANANSNQRFLTLEAFRRAGFQIRGLLNEPSAAGIEYAHQARSAAPSARRELVVVYDLGGGTFDASVISMAARRHEVVRSAGIAQLGGDDADTLLLELALAQAGAQDWTAAERARLLEECREKKEGLHPNTRRLAIDLERGREGTGTVVVSTSAFYECCQPLVARTLLTLEEAMQDLDWGAVAALYVVGGASALPLVGRLLRERYGRKVRTSPYPHAATAIGLAIAADQEAGYQLQERFTRHFGVWREAEDGRAVAFDVVFGKDCRLPAPGEAPLAGIRMKLSIDNYCKFNGFMLLSQTRAEYLRCCASFSRGLGRQTFCGGTGTGEKAAECQLGLKDRLHPPIGQSLEMSDEFEQTQFTFFLQPQGMTQLWAQRIIEHNEEHAAIEIT